MKVAGYQFCCPGQPCNGNPHCEVPEVGKRLCAENTERARRVREMTEEMRLAVNLYYENYDGR